MSKPSAKPRVVVLGGGFAGATVAKALEAKTSVTLVSDRDFLFVKYGGLRAAVRGGTWVDRTQIPLSRLFKSDGKFVQGVVASVDAANKRVVLDDGRTLEYDALVCATGSRARGMAEPAVGRSKADFKAWFDKVRAAVTSATSIVVVGGGPIGLELVGEIRDAHKTKKVTLVAGTAGVLGTVRPAFPPKFIAAWREKLAKNGVEVIDDNVTAPALDASAPFVHPDGNVVKLAASGKSIEADLVLFAIGVEVRGSVYPAEWRDPATGDLLVEPTLQVQGQPLVFAAGDVAKTGRTKLGYQATVDAGIVAANVLVALAGGKPKKTFPPPAPMMVIPFGSKQGLSALPGFTGRDWLTAKVKGRGLFANMMWGALVGDKAPVVGKDEM